MADLSSSERVSEHEVLRHALTPYFNLVLGFDHANPIAIDCAHNLLIIGSVLARKPRQILELGFGTGYLTKSLMCAINFNTSGALTTVDNWYDTKGEEPHTAKELRAAGLNLVNSGEEEFVRRAPTDFYDFLISDADHYNSLKWVDQYLRVVQHDGMLFFHDTNQPQTFAKLARLEAEIIRRKLPCFHFKQNSRPDERCDRGLLFVINKKQQKAGKRWFWLK
jgi:predicted O-methyltransferase YrrM